MVNNIMFIHCFHEIEEENPFLKQILRVLNSTMLLKLIIFNLQFMEFQKIYAVQNLFTNHQLDIQNGVELNLGNDELIQKVKGYIAIETLKNEKKKKILTYAEIFKFIDKKVNDIDNIDRQQFIVLVVTFLYLQKSQKKIPYCFSFKTQFYENLNKFLWQAYKAWIAEEGRQNQHHYLSNLYTLFFIINNFCFLSRTELTKKISVQKLMNPELMSTILKIRFPSDIKFFTYYKLLLLEVIKRKKCLLNQTQLAKSALHHFYTFQNIGGAKSLCIYLISISYNPQNQNQIFWEVPIAQFIQELRTMVLTKKKRLITRLIFQTLSKILSLKHQVLLEKFMSDEEIMKCLISDRLIVDDIDGIISFFKILKQERVLFIIEKVLKLPKKQVFIRKMLNQLIGITSGQGILKLLQNNLIQKIKQNINYDEQKSVELTFILLKKILTSLGDCCEQVQLYVKEKILEEGNIIASKGKYDLYLKIITDEEPTPYFTLY